LLRVIAIANAKGGTAKTTSAVALAAEAAHRGYRTVLIDLDVQANATDQLIGDAESDGGRSFVRTVIDGDPLTFVPTTTPGLQLVPAGRRTQDLADWLTRTVHDAAPDELGDAYEAMRLAIHRSCEHFDFVFIDTPPSEQSATLLDFVYAAATHVILPTKIDRNSTGAVSNALAQMVKLNRRGAPVGDPMGILLVDVDTSASRLTAGALANVEHIGAIVEPFKSGVAHRSGPVAYAREEKLTPRQFQLAAAEAHKRRFAALKAGRRESNPAWSHTSAAHLVEDYSAVFDELLSRLNGTAPSQS
jgi:cellulose biosynthesis protein BcsQ